MNPRPRHYEKWDQPKPPSQSQKPSYSGSARERHQDTGCDTLDSSACSSATERFDGAFPVIVTGAIQARHCVYGLIDPLEPQRVRYVGRAVNPAERLSLHIQRNPYGNTRGPGRKDLWVSRLIREGRYPDMVLLEPVPEKATQETQDEFEGRWITQMRSVGMADLNVIVPGPAGPGVRPWVRIDYPAGAALAGARRPIEHRARSSARRCVAFLRELATSWQVLS